VLDPSYAARLWEIVSDNRKEIWKRYFVASKLAKLDPLNERWKVVASDIIAHHDFAKDPLLCFKLLSRAGYLGQPSQLSTQVKGYFKKPLLKKIEQCSESDCPVYLLWEIFPPREASAVIAEGYLNGHFTWQGMFPSLAFTALDTPDFRGILKMPTTDSEREKRRQRALFLLKEMDLERDSAIERAFPRKKTQ
jgi:hypothetical protein